MEDFSALFACPLCDSSNTGSLYQKSGADLVECEDCGLKYIPSPLPEVTYLNKSNSLYKDQEGQRFGNNTVALAKTYQLRLRDAESYLGGRGRLLDLGCTLGLYGFNAQQSGWDVFVTDISEFAVKRAASDFQLKAFVSPVGKLPVKAGSFDFISAFEIIDHTSQPLDLLDEIRNRLKPGGIVHITTPNINSLLAKFMGKKWFYFNPEDHLIYFEPKTLQAALEKAGFEVLQIRKSTRYMSVGEIVQHFRPFAKKTCDLILKMLRLVGVDRWIVKFHLGEMEAFVKNNQQIPLALSSETANTMDVLCCPKCGGELDMHFPQVWCAGCSAVYGVEHGVINFSKYSKKQSLT